MNTPYHIICKYQSVVQSEVVSSNSSLDVCLELEHSKQQQGQRATYTRWENGDLGNKMQAASEIESPPFLKFGVLE